MDSYDYDKDLDDPYMFEKMRREGMKGGRTPRGGPHKDEEGEVRPRAYEGDAKVLAAGWGSRGSSANTSTAWKNMLAAMTTCLLCL